MKELIKGDLTIINGGEFELVKWFKGTVWFFAAGYVINHWADLKSGIVDGYTDAIKQM